MSAHLTLTETIYVGYSPVADRKWCPKGMEAQRWYLVIGIENAQIETKDKGNADAVFYHFVGKGQRPCRLIQSNAVLALPWQLDSETKRAEIWKSIAASLVSGPADPNAGF